MELSQFTDYSLRVLIFVALKEGGERSSVTEIATAYDISRNHLVKVVHNLSKLGYIETQRGRGGGVSLLRPAAEIRVGDVVREIESLALLECFPPREGQCCLSGNCDLQTVLGRAMAAFLAELDAVTLADLTHKKNCLKQLLSI